MSRQSLEALRRTITVDWKQAREKDAREFLIATARKGNAEIVAEQTARAGIRPSVEQYANMPGNPNIETVRLPGPIVFLYDYRPEIVTMAIRALRDASPVRSGAYRDSHTILLNGVQIDEPPARLSERDELVIVNPVPYARRLEIGKTLSGRDFVLQVPNRIYERVAKKVLIPRYRNVAQISFGYLELSGSYVVKGGLTSHYGTGRAAGPRGGSTTRKRRQKVGERIKSPAIFIRAFA